MRVLVCGARNWTDGVTLHDCLDRIASGFRIDVVIEGEQYGADLMARAWAEEHHILVAPFPADWEGRGRKAGPERNQRMLEQGRPDLVVAFPTAQSVGTWHMVNIARRAGVKTWVMPNQIAEVDALGEGVFA